MNGCTNAPHCYVIRRFFSGSLRRRIVTPRRVVMCIKGKTKGKQHYYLSLPGGGETTVAQWLRCCATNRKVAGSIPDGVFGIFQ